MSGRTFGAWRKTAILLNVTVMVALAAAAAGVAIYLTGFTNLRRRIDLTRTHTYTLSPATLAMLGNLERDVEIVSVKDGAKLYWDVDNVRPQAMEYVRDLLIEFQVRSGGKVSVDNLDVVRDETRVRDLVRELELREYNFVVVRCGANRRVLSLDGGDLAEIDFGSGELGRPIRLIAYRVEEAVSGAIFGVVEDERPKVYVVTGHDELGLGGPAAPLAASLRKDNVELIEWQLFAQRRIPDDAAAVFLLGPQNPLVEEERKALDAYLRRGGKLLVLNDPLGDRSLDPLWNAIGLDVERNVIVYPQSSVLAEDQIAHYIGRDAQGSYGVHPITADLVAGEKKMKIVGTGAVSPREGSQLAFTTLIASHARAFGDVPVSDAPAGGNERPHDYAFDPRNGETQGQRVLAAALEPKDGPYAGARVVFVASVIFAAHPWIAQSPANEEFLRRATSWLLGRRKSIDLPPRRPSPMVSDLHGEEKESIFRYTVLGLPTGAALIALLVWFARRR